MGLPRYGSPFLLSPLTFLFSFARGDPLAGNRWLTSSPFRSIFHLHSTIGFNMCADGWNHRDTAKEIKECPACGGEVDEDGDAIEGCNYSPVDCTVCGSAPCDQSC